MNKKTNPKKLINMNHIEKLIKLSLAIFLSYLVTYKFFFMSSIGGRNIGYIYFFILVFLIYLMGEYLATFFISSLKFLVSKLDKRPIEDNPLKKYIITPLVIFIGTLATLLFFISLYYVVLYWTASSLNEFGLIGLNINDKILKGITIIAIIYLLISEILILHKYGKISILKSFLIGSLHSSFIILLIYLISKIIPVLLTILMIIIGILLFGIEG